MIESNSFAVSSEGEEILNTLLFTHTEIKKDMACEKQNELKTRQQLFSSY